MVVVFLGTRGVGDGSRVARGLNGNPRERNDMMKNGGQESKRTCRGGARVRVGGCQRVLLCVDDKIVRKERLVILRD